MFADMQDSGDPDCELWKKKVSQAQAKVKQEGKVLQAAVNETEKEVGAYTADQKIDCSQNCSTKLGMDGNRKMGIRIKWSIKFCSDAIPQCAFQVMLEKRVWK